MEVWNGIWKKILVWNGIWNGRFLVWNGNGMEENFQNGIWKNRLPFHKMFWSNVSVTDVLITVPLAHADEPSTLKGRAAAILVNCFARVEMILKSQTPNNTLPARESNRETATF